MSAFLRLLPRSGRRPGLAPAAALVAAAWSLVVPAARGAAAAAETNTPPSRTELSSYRLVWERNIFNPNRSARGTPPPRTETRRAPRVDSITLLGTMSYPKGSFAFFEGSSSDFRKSLGVGGSIGGCTLESISTSGVKLDLKGRKLELKVSDQLRREEDGEWTVSAATAGERPSSGGDRDRDRDRGGSSGSRGDRRGDREERGEPGGGGPPASPAASEGSASESSGEVSDVLKRLMEQREKELNK